MANVNGQNDWLDWVGAEGAEPKGAGPEGGRGLTGGAYEVDDDWAESAGGGVWGGTTAKALGRG